MIAALFYLVFPCIETTLNIMLELLPVDVCNCLDEKVACTTIFYLFFGCEVEGGFGSKGCG